MQSEHAVGASSRLVQREECHHLAPADTSIPLPSARVWRDAAAICVGSSVGISVCMAQDVQLHLNDTACTFEKSSHRYVVVVWVLRDRERALAASCEAFSITSI